MSVFDKTLIISPHLDDETIGCGGLISKLRRQGKQVYVLIATTPRVFQAKHLGGKVDINERLDSFIRAMRVLNVPGDCMLRLKEEFLEGMMDTYPISSIINCLEEVIYKVHPTAVLFPYSSHHQDHQILNKASIAALRSKVSSNFIKLKAMYEYPYITGWNSSIIPTGKIYIDLSRENVEDKSRALSAYDSQLDRDPRDPADKSSILSLLSIRGREVGIESAEVLYPISMVL